MKKALFLIQGHDESIPASTFVGGETNDFVFPLESVSAPWLGEQQGTRSSRMHRQCHDRTTVQLSTYCVKSLSKDALLVGTLDDVLCLRSISNRQLSLSFSTFDTVLIIFITDIHTACVVRCDTCMAALCQNHSSKKKGLHLIEYGTFWEKGITTCHHTNNLNVVSIFLLGLFKTNLKIWLYVDFNQLFLTERIRSVCRESAEALEGTSDCDFVRRNDLRRSDAENLKGHNDPVSLHVSLNV